jgi:glycosyltransferase involved in cell wall biosynthesis
LKDNIIVMLSTEGTYPFHQGGVSTWCDILVQKLKSVDYVIYSVLMNPFVTQKFELPNQDALLKMPLWGTEEPSEHLDTPFSHIYKMKKNTFEAQITDHFIPLFRELITEIISLDKDPFRLGRILLQLHLYFQQYEYKVTFKSEQTWNTYKDLILAAVEKKGLQLDSPDVYGLNQSLGWIYRFLNILNTPLPKAHVTHSSAAAFCGIPCVLSKMLNKTPYLLTEHGVYLREHYLGLSKNGYSPFLRTFLIRLVQSISSMNYAYADQVSPVCQYNMRWETRFGVPRPNIKVIYNGVDENVFEEANGAPQSVPTVVMVARIDPIKDILTFVRTAAIVREQMPTAKFIVYGSVSVPDYYEQCLQMKEELQLGDAFIFAGHTSNMSAAYQSGDVIALSSISEAFPYSVVEAMMTGKPVIATDVGGIKEALSDTGLLVQPRDPQAMASGILKLLNNRELREDLGKEARERALNMFTLDRVLDLHLKSYIKLAVVAEERTQAASSKRTAAFQQKGLPMQKLYMERGYALSSAGYDEQAIEQFRKALAIHPNSVFTPILLAEMANLYNRMGEYDRAFQELVKYEAYMALVGSEQGA